MRLTSRTRRAHPPRTAELRGSFRPRLPWTESAKALRNYRPGRSSSSVPERDVDRCNGGLGATNMTPSRKAARAQAVDKRTASWDDAANRAASAMAGRWESGDVDGARAVSRCDTDGPERVGGRRRAGGARKTRRQRRKGAGADGSGNAWERGRCRSGWEAAVRRRAGGVGTASRRDACGAGAASRRGANGVCGRFPR